MLVGTGVGPRVDLQQFGPSTLIEAGNERLLFDCGRGATLRLTQMGSADRFDSTTVSHASPL
jgi:ribonuclease Z